jgi:periplasmic protein TonB
MRRIGVLLATCVPLLSACATEEQPIEWPAVLSEASTVQYPVELWDLGIEGESLVLVRVDQLGNVDSVRIARSSGYAEFDSAAIAGVRELQFRPGRIGDKRVDMWVRLPVKFTQAGGAELGRAEEETSP